MAVNIHIEPEEKVALFGIADRHLKTLREALGVHLMARGDVLKVSGDPEAVERCTTVIAAMRQMLRQRDTLDSEHIAAAIRMGAGQAQRHQDDLPDMNSSGHRAQPRTEGQKRYVEAIQTHDMVFCAGPAGTGKTFLAVALAVSMLRRGEVRRLVLVRPAVEAGEKLGFLPGDIQAKVNPYLRPLLDALHDMMPFDQIRRFMANDIIELAPLAYMRGRTLNHSIVLLDEAQNTTPAQMLMFLTRLGEGSKMIVNGDPTQVDLEPGQVSGLVDARHKLTGIHGIAFVELDKSDIVRHRLVQNVVHAYHDK
ncbi:MAG TPA: PhoH family protein [Phycisphaerae bacterium]|nr:PhoH family protein [Phycisphaerae bacterium]